MDDARTSRSPLQVDLFPSGEIGILWRDGHESVYGCRYLRCQCPCAGCVDEMTGRKTLVDEHIAADIVPRLVQGVGNYAVQFVWSDGHATGIYSHEYLRALCPCAACRSRR